MPSTYGAYNNTYTITSTVHIEMKTLSIINILFAMTPLQIGKGVKQDDPSVATCLRFMPIVNSHPPPPALRTFLLLLYWFQIGPLLQSSVHYSSLS